jgi:hypothetical protein
MTAIEDARLDEDRERVGAAFEMQLVARLPIEGTAAIGADLGPDAFVA